mgnify:FL=1|jgi:hypothetical protein|tara:strand:- start:302 stop:529 length:228 start_codon:yes stop_codon:yes gene_type:complete
MENYIKVEDNADLVRDKHSGAIVNTNTTAYDRAVARSKLAQKQRDDLRSATREINNIKCEMHEIKTLLEQLVGKE